MFFYQYILIPCLCALTTATAADKMLKVLEAEAATQKSAI